MFPLIGWWHLSFITRIYHSARVFFERKSRRATNFVLSWGIVYSGDKYLNKTRLKDDLFFLRPIFSDDLFFPTHNCEAPVALVENQYSWQCACACLGAGDNKHKYVSTVCNSGKYNNPGYVVTVTLSFWFWWSYHVVSLFHTRARLTR